MNNILITGANGFLGSILKETLINTKKCNIIIYDTNLYSKESELFSKEHDFRDIDFNKLDKIDIVIHLAGISTNYDPPERIYSDLAMEINHQATINFAIRAKKAGVKKFIFSSSASIYGESNDLIVNEKSDPNPLTSYAKSKLFAEKELLELHSNKFSVIILRMVTLFGLSERMRFDVLINNLILSALINKKILLHGNGQAIRPQIHLKDACKIYEAIIFDEHNDYGSEVINIGRSDYNLEVKQFAEKIANNMNCDVIIGKNKTIDNRSYNVDFNKQEKLFPNINFEYNLENACFEIENLFKSKINQKNWHQNTIYYNLKHMEILIKSNILLKS